VRLALGLHHRIARQLQATPLEVLLELRLRVLVDGAAAGALEPVAQQALDRVGEDRGTPEAAALELALAQPQPLAQAQLARDLEERRLVHEPGAQPREIAFGKLRETLVEERGDDAVEEAVAEELQALVVRSAEAAVRDRLAREIRRGEAVPQAAFQLDEALEGLGVPGRPARHCEASESDEADSGAVDTEKSRQALML
jgi:hypothetical protein